MVDVSELNASAAETIVEDKQAQLKRQDKMANAKQILAPLADDLISDWEEVGLSSRQAEIAAYRQLGSTDKTIAFFTGLSRNTVNEHNRRIREKYQQAKSLVDRVESTKTLDKGWRCPRCGHMTRRQNADISVDPESEKVKSHCGDWECGYCDEQYLK
ncbi:helix-turn-helix transcriptional regulator [Haloarcula onubensis]|uniref:HTH luxR-type domain-containing protein n=1 Tax=Haloarcula onubensis TaxID=2950539 RepID=A0ABU2FVF8_9EURY|nr:hypothetical protein [Halomicroarcula sp. S3CR25-11]MDS0284768.1 hypothetical protein [Halomicroarcula sp. S3CR25-11]